MCILIFINDSLQEGREGKGHGQLDLKEVSLSLSGQKKGSPTPKTTTRREEGLLCQITNIYY